MTEELRKEPWNQIVGTKVAICELILAALPTARLTQHSARIICSPSDFGNVLPSGTQRAIVGLEVFATIVKRTEFLCKD